MEFTRRFLKFLLFVSALHLLTVSSVGTAAQPHQQDSSVCPDGTITTANGECTNPNAVAADVVEEQDTAPTPPTPEDPKCPSRPHIIRCAAKYLDTNKNA